MKYRYKCEECGRIYESTEVIARICQSEECQENNDTRFYSMLKRIK